MDQLTRFVRELASRLAVDEAGRHEQVKVAEIREQVLPYRLHRRSLGLDSVEDYETVLLRLVAEEGGHVKTSPAAAQRCREELAQPNPDLGVLEELGDSTVQLLSPAFASEEDRPMSVNQPQEEIPHYETAELSMKGPPPAILQHPQLCPHCSDPVPQGRAVTYCPWCGKRLAPVTCVGCGTELEAEWRHCVSCGAAQ